MYRLIGVVEHSGSMRGGHYVAYVRGGSGETKEEQDGAYIEGRQSKCEKSTWFYCSDTHVRESGLGEVLGCEAYILFYQRIESGGGRVVYKNILKKVEE